MLRFRRYRVFLVAAFITLVLFLRVGKNSNWEPPAPLPRSAKGSGGRQETNIRPPRYQPPPPPATVETDESEDRYRGATPDGPPRQPPKHEQNIEKPPEKDYKVEKRPKKDQKIEIPVLQEEHGYRDYALPAVTSKKVANLDNPGKSQPASVLPGAAAANAAVGAPGPTPAGAAEDDNSPVTPKKQPGAIAKPSRTPAPRAHREKQSEFFPVPSESLIRLPTGQPKPIPTIQALFPPESPGAKERRERRLATVKSEAERAWQGYKKYAWGHDEVMPVSKKARDPFCGWAATLVDSLDTLWIMGLQDEFDDAVWAVARIDFTTSPYRKEIPVFETIIRYLGGLLAAYDVSGGGGHGGGGAYGVLLDKALELAEVLMGAFDTPNRMPVLYYNWMPDYASQPHRASNAASVAELGSMSMEFTRLAQLTGQDRFYDAIARITDAFEEWQTGGTALDGIFPQVVDASGCNRTALRLMREEEVSAAAKEQARLEAERVREEEEAEEEAAEEAEGYKPAASAEAEDDVESGQSVRAKSRGAGVAFDSPALAQQRANALEDAKNHKRSLAPASNATKAAQIPRLAGQDPHANSRFAPFAASGQVVEWDCPAQPLVAGGYGASSFSMGGSQDSAYEYFPKQYLLLGGLEPKYRTMHERTVKAVKKHLLYRPMIKDESRSLLFSAEASVRRKSSTYSYEATHLTCFLGGMFALGGKIFGSDEDVGIGAKLADGCAWAYEVMPTGIMPEMSIMTPCESMDDCQWNETAWHEALDPRSSWREAQMERYLEMHKLWEDEVRNITELAEAEKERAGRPAEAAAPEWQEEEGEKLRPVNDTLPGKDGPARLKVDSASGETASNLRSESDELPSVHKRSPGDASDSILERNRKAMEINEMTEELDSSMPSTHRPGHHGYKAPTQSSQTTLDDELDLPPEPKPPQTHDEYIKYRVKREKLPPGFVSLNDKRYILRPEAIESIWYMYRITGDPIWQEKGWRMFESIIAATSVPDGHSAIRDVTKRNVTFVDNMESFWLAETLKYFYLLFAPPDVLSLDEWVFNTEAHPFRRPT